MVLPEALLALRLLCPPDVAVRSWRRVGDQQAASYFSEREGAKHVHDSERG